MLPPLILTNISASIGILYDEKVEKNLEDTLLKSDMAMYHAKGSGKGRYVVFNDIADIVFSELEMEKKQQALENREFEVHYLPIVMAQTPRLYMAQAYVVWHMADGRCRQQEEFLPLFEKNGFIKELNNWVIERVLQDISGFRGRKMPLELNGWTSVLYARYSNGYASLVPCTMDRFSIYWVYQDDFVNDYHDIQVRMIQRNKWSFLCVSYDATTGVGRLYLNGRLAGVTEEITRLPACRQILLGGDPFQQSFHGYVSGLIFCDSAMTELEIKDIYRDFCKDSGFAGEREEF